MRHKPGFANKKKALFMGETMICAVCGRIGFSDPHKESQWTALEIEDEPIIYFCPICFGNAKLEAKNS